MDKIIGRYDYANGDETKEQDLSSDLQDSASKYAETMTTDGMKKIIDVFINKICIRPFPERMSKPYWMCYTTVNAIGDVLIECEDNGRLTKEQCQGHLLDLMLALITKGQGSTHFTLISRIFEFMDMDKYLEEMKGPQIFKVLDAIKQQEYVEEKETGIRDYGGYYNDAVGFIFERVLGERDCTKHLEPDIHTAVLDLYMCLLVKITENREELVEYITYVRHHVWYRYEHQPYKGCKDSKLLRTHLGIIRTIISKPEFPRFEEELKQVTDTFEYLLSGIVLDSDMIKELWCDIAEFVKYLCQMPNNTRFMKMLNEYKSFMFDVPDEIIAENSDLFTNWATTMTTILSEWKDTETEVLSSFMSKGIPKVVDKTKPKADFDVYMIPLLNSLLKNPDGGIAYAAELVIKHSKYKKIWSWKKNVEGAKMIINTIKDATLPTEGDENDERGIMRGYGNTLRELMEQLELVKVNFEVMPEFIELFISSLEKSKKSSLITDFLSCVTKSLDMKKHTALIPDIVKRFDVLYKDTDYPWTEGWCMSCGNSLLEAVTKAYKDGSEIPENVNEILISMFMFAMDENTDRVDYQQRTLNIYGATVVSPLREFASKHNDGDTIEVVGPLIPSLFRMLEDDSENIQEISSYILFGVIAMKSPQMLASDEYLNKILHYYLNQNQEYEVLDAIHHIYPHNPELVNKCFQDIFSMFGQNTVMDNGFLHFFQQVVETHPQVFTKKNIDKFKSHMIDPQLSFFVLYILEKISIKQTDILEDMVTYIISLDNVPPNTCVWIKDIFSRVAINNQKFLSPVLKYFIMRTQGEEHETQFLGYYDGMRKLAHKYGSEPFKPYREYLDEQKNSASSANIKTCVTTLIDELEGRSLETVEKVLEQQKEDIENLDGRVSGAELVVGSVIQQVDRHEDEIRETKGDIETVNKRVDNVEGDIVEVKEKVEEIDMKTMSNAPKWSRDVTKLLNPESEHDWRLLASRLGYSNDDIRAWATQSDPCMALLSEWYATHNTKEATSGVLNVLQEMNRLDAASIVENAMKAAEDVVEDEDFEYPSPPPVFLSYQWGHQNEVKLLRQHLQMAGYECWMDIGQMGGGDKLFEKIDSGIRGAKVVICCVSEKYAKSPNCNREVNLAVNLRKPMIPLQMEKIAWPPVGSMGPIFSEYLYIRFYSGGTDGKYWADSKFQELLMQLQFNNVVPDEKLITKEYKNWWIPVAEEIIVKKDEKSNSKKVTDVKEENKSEQENNSPDVFLSYQWGKQKQIQALYQKLTSLGFHCWMDIHQMGGGDSLYDKIDRGVRGCKVVVSSITQKYALSANCRREVSLADALKKPIIPLLLEDISWPPSGPMSMVLTQLLYINFCKDPAIQTKWSGKEFEELLAKLKLYVEDLSKEETTQKEPDKVKPEEQNTTNDKNQKDSGPKQKTTEGAPKSASRSQSSRNERGNTSQNDQTKNTTEPPKKKSNFCSIL